MPIDYLVTDTELSDIADAIRAKGGTSSQITFPNGFTTAIAAIPTGTDVSDTTATASDVLSGKYFYTSAGTKTQGSITSKSAQTYTPTTSNQTISSGQYLSGAQTILGDANLVAGNIKKNVSIFNVTGSYEGGGGGASIDTVSGYGSFTQSITPFPVAALSSKILVLDAYIDEAGNTIRLVCSPPDNSIPSFVTAENSGPWGMWCDFSLSSDGTNFIEIELDSPWYFDAYDSYALSLGAWTLYIISLS